MIDLCPLSTDIEVLDPSRKRPDLFVPYLGADGVMPGV